MIVVCDGLDGSVMGCIADNAATDKFLTWLVRFISSLALQGQPGSSREFCNVRPNNRAR
jgi:hypothetical protein